MIEASRRGAATSEPSKARRQAPRARAKDRIIVMARWPAPGRCKRRLAAGCGSSLRASAIQGRLTSHTLRVAGTAAAARGAQLLLAVDGLAPGALRRWERALRLHGDWPQADRLRIARQGGGNLGCRMQAELRRGFADGAAQVVLIGTDLPGLECRDLTTALSLLRRHPLVIGPASDGGYWLLGLNRAGFEQAGARLMSGIRWGGADVLRDTLKAASLRALPVTLLRKQRDLDHRSDLAAWSGTPNGADPLGRGLPWR